MAISEEQKEEVKAKVDIADLISSYGFSLRQRGSELWCCCPFHTEKTPSFKVDVTRGTYHCFGCGESGDAFSFVMKQEGLSFVDSIRKLASSVGIELSEAENPTAKTRKRLYGLMAELALDFNKMLKSTRCQDAEIAREYVKRRNLDEAVVNKFLIGYAPKEVDKILSWASRHGYSYQDLVAAGIIKPSGSARRPPYFYFANRLVFAVKDKNGQVVAFSGRQLLEDKKSGKYVNSPETIIFKKARTFFGFDEARKNIVKAPNREAIICEGQIDCIRLHANGFTNAVAPLGTAFTEEHAVMLHRVADNALLCFDDDSAGHKATIRAAQLLLAEGMPIRVLVLPNGEDPDSYITKHGKDAFAKLATTNIESIVQFQIRASRALEENPDETNAALRITKSVLETIAKCRDKVQRTLLLKEAAKRLGVDYATLAGEIAETVKTEIIEQRKVSEHLIDPIVAGKAEDVNTKPSVLEGALINFLLEKRDDSNVKTYLSKLIPLGIIRTNTAKKIVKSILEYEGGETDSIRRAVEALSTDEYKTFIAIMANNDGTTFASVPDKVHMLYFARQLWNNYLSCLLSKIGDDRSEKEIVVNAIKVLNTATSKKLVNLMLSFPINKFEKVA